MDSNLSVVGLLASQIIPWLCGALWLHWLLGHTGRRNASVVLGQGYFLGILITCTVIRAWDAAGLMLSFWGIAAVVAGLSLPAIVLLVMRPGVAETEAGRGTGTGTGLGQSAQINAPWQLGLITFLLALIAWRHLTLLQELLTRPLFAWDAWMNWVPKAVVWFHSGSLVDFVSAQQWLQQSSTEVFTLGNRQASVYPIMVPLIQLWSMLGLGTWDHSAVYLSWIIAPLALGLALYGHLRLAGVTALAATIAAYLLLSMPYLNVHSVMAGYADSWLAAAFGLAVCSLYQWRHSRHWVDALLVLVFAAMCMQLKNPGLVLGLIVIACGALSAANVRPKMFLGIIVALALLFLLVNAVGVSLKVPYLGVLALEDGNLNVGRLGEFSLAYHAVGDAFVGTFFEQINWHLFWYLLPPALLLIWVQRGVSFPQAELWAVIGALLFVILVFVFTKHYKAAINFVTLNRALMYAVPALVFCVFLSLRQSEDETLD